MPENEKCFFVANHPFSFLDGLTLTNIAASKYGNFRAIGNDIFILVPQLKPLIAAVNVFSSSPKKYLMELEKLFASDMPIHFPASIVSRVGSRKIENGDWQKSFVNRSIIWFRFFLRSKF